MPTILKTLSSVVQPDGTLVTTSNPSGWTSVAVTSPGKIAVEDDDKMGAAVGFRFTQPAAEQVNAFLDFDAALPDPAFRKPLKLIAPPKMSTTWIRFFPEVAGAPTSGRVNLGTLSLTTSNRIQFFEPGTGGLNQTSDGAALVPGAAYVVQLAINVVSGVFDLRVFPLGSDTASATLQGALGGAMKNVPIGSIRVGIATANGLDAWATNNTFAAGYGGFLPRTDLAPLAATISQSKTTGATGTGITYTVSSAGGDGSAKTYAVAVEYSANGTYNDTVVVAGTLDAATRTYQASPTFEFTPSAPGKYRARGYVSQSA